MRFFVLPFAAALALPVSARADLPPDIAKAVAAIGHVNDVPNTIKLFVPLQPKEPLAGTALKAERDVAYGSDPLQKLDVVWDGKADRNRPIVVWVHGGGFVGGTKRTEGRFDFDNIMKWVSEQDMVGVNINYRLAPKNKYPDAMNDIRDALAWTAKNAGKYGGDPNRIFLWGHSAGASLVGIYASHPEFHYRRGGGIIGAVMGSGGYEATPGNFFGSDPTAVKAASSVEGLKKTAIPLFFTRAEWDPESPMIQQGEMLNRELTNAGKDHVYLIMKTHNHMSQVYSIGTPETQFTDRLGPWMKQQSTNAKPSSN